jgi:hypothetical protein
VVNQKQQKIGALERHEKVAKVKEKNLISKEIRFFFGGDYWTRTSDLLRVKIRLCAKGLLSGAFRYFLLRFFRAGKRS